MDVNITGGNSIKLRIIKRTSYGLGFLLHHDEVNQACVISGLVPGCDAEKSQLVAIGDRLSAINGVNVETLTFHEILAVLDALPVERPAIILLKGSPNCRIQVVTYYDPNGRPKTRRITEPLVPVQNGHSNCPVVHQNGDTVRQNGHVDISAEQLGKFNSDLQDRLGKIEEMMQGLLNANISGKKENEKKLEDDVFEAPRPSPPSSFGGERELQVQQLQNQRSRRLSSVVPDSGSLGNARLAARRKSFVTAATGTLQSQAIPSKTGDLSEERPVKEGSMVNNSHTRLGLRCSAALDADTHAHLSPSPSPTHVKKYVKLKNLLDGKTFVDTLHRSTAQTLGCTANRCTSSLLNLSRPQNSLARSNEEVLPLAKDFIRQYFESTKRLNTPAHDARWTEVEAQIHATGNYEFKEQELTFAAKAAWRNSQRCIGRIQWSKLQVFDARFINTPRTMFEALLNHIKYSTNRGNLRSAITIFKQRTTPEQDFRIWNAQLVRYAGYKQDDGSVVGDPASVELTEVCQKLGWKGSGGRFDVLPLVLSAAGQDPEYFDIPRDIVLQVAVHHAEYPGLADMGLKWYALPAVANMVFDVGGIFFPAVAFSGWYMQTEIARDFVDPTRYNLLEDIANVFGFDTTRVSSLWKDQTFLELNKAILSSFQTSNVTIVDHHSASESFMKHLENEQKARGGCPADWVWIVPPMGGSLVSVYHQEMLDYRLSPCYDYQDEAWKAHVWKKDKVKLTAQKSNPKRKFGFREIARAVKFSAKLMAKALARRIRATIIYATETGKSERYAKTLFDVFKYGFDVNVVCAEHYDLAHLEHEALLLVVTSTFGNGDPPDNGKEIAAYLHQLSCPDDISGKKSQSYIRMDTRSVEGSLSRQTTFADQDNFMDSGGPLSNVRFAVFGLGSSSYPHFCAFAQYVDQSLGALGGECILPIHTGDELRGQDQSFKLWAHEVFKVACDVFCLGDDVNMVDAQAALSNGDSSWSKGRYRLRANAMAASEDLQTALSRTHNKNVQQCKLVSRRDLQSKLSLRQTILVQLESEESIAYQPGDHVAIFAENDPQQVMALLDRLGMRPNQAPVQVEVLVEKASGMAVTKSWKALDRLPLAPMEVLFASFLDITTPPSQMLLENLASLARSTEELDRLLQLSKNTEEYEAWKTFKWPTLLEVLEEFQSVEVDPTLLLIELPQLQPRFYSISSSPLTNPKVIDATVGLISYRTQNGAGPIHPGVCTAFLSQLQLNSPVHYYIRTASTFRLPDKITIPIYMIGAGTGIAPFRSFWQHFEKLRARHQADNLEVHLIFGCRNSELDHIYQSEITQLQQDGVLKSFHLALSRQEYVPKTYVQNVIPKIAATLLPDIRVREAHVYVCGDVSMAAGVYNAIREAFEAGGFTAAQTQHLMNHLRSSDRYHEDIFGNYNMASGY